MEKIVLPIHFEARSGTEFERLVFAYVASLRKWKSIEWLGQTGSDQGRDVWGKINGKCYCYLCANRKKMDFKKSQTDIDKLVKNNTVPHCLIQVCGNQISPNLRKKIKDYAISKGVQEVEVWSGAEFEEKLRKDTPVLIERFVNGVEFPDSSRELIHFNKKLNDINDGDIVDLLTECFDRPAFRTRFWLETNLPDFEKAIKNTIEVLNTGIHRLNDRTEIRRIPSRHSIDNQNIKSKLAEITQLVVELRDSFVDLKRKKEIKNCGCNDPDCPTYQFSTKACEIMDGIRQEIFNKIREIKPDCNLGYY